MYILLVTFWVCGYFAVDPDFLLPQHDVVRGQARGVRAQTISDGSIMIELTLECDLGVIVSPVNYIAQAMK